MVNFSDGLTTNEGTPIASIITTSISTTLYALLALVITTEYVSVDVLKKLFTVSLTIPQFAGFTLWILNDTQETRKLYLNTQYVSYYSLLAGGVYLTVKLVLEYLFMGSETTKQDLTVTGSCLLIFGVLNLFMLMAF